MDVTITLGWWLLPLVLTIITASIGCYKFNQVSDKGGGGWYSGLGDIFALFIYGGTSVVLILVYWLIYFIIF